MATSDQPKPSIDARSRAACAQARALAVPVGVDGVDVSLPQVFPG